MRLIASVACVYCGAEFDIDSTSITAMDEMSLRLAEHVAKVHPARRCMKRSDRVESSHGEHTG